MFRRSLVAFFGTPPVRRVPNPPFIHAVAKPGAPAKVNYSELNLSFPVQNPNAEFTIATKAWAPKPEKLPTNLPFLVHRVEGSGGFPVYSRVVGGRTKKVTVIRRIAGDAYALQKELQKLVGPETKVEVRPGTIVVDGNFGRRIKLYLLAMGM